MVEHQPSKLDTWVRFPSPAFFVANKYWKSHCSIEDYSSILQQPLQMIAFFFRISYCLSDRLKRFLQIHKNILDMLRSDGKADRIRLDALFV